MWYNVVFMREGEKQSQPVRNIKDAVKIGLKYEKDFIAIKDCESGVVYDKIVDINNKKMFVKLI